MKKLGLVLLALLFAFSFAYQIKANVDGGELAVEVDVDELPEEAAGKPSEIIGFPKSSCKRIPAQDGYLVVCVEANKPDLDLGRATRYQLQRIVNFLAIKSKGKGVQKVSGGAGSKFSTTGNCNPADQPPSLCTRYPTDPDCMTYCSTHPGVGGCPTCDSITWNSSTCGAPTYCQHPSHISESACANEYCMMNPSSTSQACCTLFPSRPGCESQYCQANPNSTSPECCRLDPTRQGCCGQMNWDSGYCGAMSYCEHPSHGTEPQCLSMFCGNPTNSMNPACVSYCTSHRGSPGCSGCTSEWDWNPATCGYPTYCQDPANTSNYQCNSYCMSNPGVGGCSSCNSPSNWNSSTCGAMSYCEHPSHRTEPQCIAGYCSQPMNSADPACIAHCSIPSNRGTMGCSGCTSTADWNSMTCGYPTYCDDPSHGTEPSCLPTFCMSHYGHPACCAAFPGMYGCSY